MKEIACFITPHGFGHAARAIAVIEACQIIQPDIHAHFFTTVARSLFAETLTGFTHHPVLVDIGLIQNSALEADVPATIEQLNVFQPFGQGLIEDLAALCTKCSLILCDIAPLGIAVAQYAGIPSILVENFTWDWVYRSYAKKYPKIEPHIQFLQELYTLSDYRIQTEPLCFSAPGDLHCGPIYRRKKGNITSVREQIGCGGKKLVVVTMGGVFQQIPADLNMEALPNIHFLFTGQRETKQIEENVSLLARDSGIYHPDLLSAADVVVCKAGYSTVAECCQAGARVISVGRADFPESAPLQKYLQNQLAGVSISTEMYQDGSWIAVAAELLLRPKPVGVSENGADKVADFICNLV